MSKIKECTVQIPLVLLFDIKTLLQDQRAVVSRANMLLEQIDDFFVEEVEARR